MHTRGRDGGVVPKAEALHLADRTSEALEVMWEHWSQDLMGAVVLPNCTGSAGARFAR
jgi:hypothetical protein